MKKITYDISSYSNFGVVKFGASMSEVRAAVASPYSYFQKSLDEYTPTDAFDELGFHVHYDKQDKCLFLETFEPMTVSYQHKMLTNKRFGDLKPWLATLTDNLKIEDGSVNMRDLGFGFSLSYDQKAADYTDNSIIKSVFAYSKDYLPELDRLEEYMASLK